MTDAGFRLVLVAIRDIKAEAFTRPPFACIAIGQALRIFQDLANDTSTDINRHPGDFSLWLLGEFNQVTGVITPNKTGPLDMGSALQFRSAELSLLKEAQS